MNSFAGFKLHKLDLKTEEASVIDLPAPSGYVPLRPLQAGASREQVDSARAASYAIFRIFPAGENYLLVLYSVPDNGVSIIKSRLYNLETNKVYELNPSGAADFSDGEYLYELSYYNDNNDIYGHLRMPRITAYKLNVERLSK